jgi:hypothetical protein
MQAGICNFSFYGFIILYQIIRPYWWGTVSTLKTGYPYTSSKSRQGARCASTWCHIICSFRPHLTTEVDSDATTCPAALDFTSLLSWVSTLSRIPQLRTSPSWWDELWCCHVSRGLGARLLIEENSGAATCPSTPNLTFLLRWALMLPRIPRAPVGCGP